MPLDDRIQFSEIAAPRSGRSGELILFITRIAIAIGKAGGDRNSMLVKVMVAVCSPELSKSSPSSTLTVVSFTPEIRVPPPPAVTPVIQRIGNVSSIISSEHPPSWDHHLKQTPIHLTLGTICDGVCEGHSDDRVSLKIICIVACSSYVVIVIAPSPSAAIAVVLNSPAISISAMAKNALNFQFVIP